MIAWYSTLRFHDRMVLHTPIFMSHIHCLTVFMLFDGGIHRSTIPRVLCLSQVQHLVKANVAHDGYCTLLYLHNSIHLTSLHWPAGLPSYYARGGHVSIRWIFNASQPCVVCMYNSSIKALPSRFILSGWNECGVVVVVWWWWWW